MIDTLRDCERILQRRARGCIAAEKSAATISSLSNVYELQISRSSRPVCLEKAAVT